LEEIEQKPLELSWRKLSGKQDQKLKDKPTEETAEEHYENPFLKLNLHQTKKLCETTICKSGRIKMTKCPLTKHRRSCDSCSRRPFINGEVDKAGTVSHTRQW
jgi:hypothetical protein